jgi:hypothetical protein
LVTTTEAEALTLVREHALAQLGPDVVLAYTRVGEGRWDYAVTGTLVGDSPKQFRALVGKRWAPTDFDDLYCYTLITEPGELVTRSELDLRFPDRAAKLLPLLDAVGWADISYAFASVRSRCGFVGRLAVIHRRMREVNFSL